MYAEDEQTTTKEKCYPRLGSEELLLLCLEKVNQRRNAKNSSDYIVEKQRILARAHLRIRQGASQKVPLQLSKGAKVLQNIPKKEIIKKQGEERIIIM